MEQSLSYQLLPDVVLIHSAGPMDNDDLRDTLQEIRDDPAFQPGSKILVHDLGSAFNPTEADLEESARILLSFENAFAPRVALVAPMDFMPGAGATTNISWDEQHVELRGFRDVDEALQWLQT